MNITWKSKLKDCSARHLTYITILGTYVTILGTLLGILLTWSQLRIAQNGEDRARRTEPLAYTLEAVNTHYQYEIQKDNTTIFVPAPSFRLQVIHGSLHTITAISFDGTMFHELSSLPMRDSWNGCTVDVTMPAYSIIHKENLVYDYFFLFLEPTEGQSQLDLVCSVVDLNTQEVTNSVLHSVDLVQLDYLDESPKKQMLTAYNTLQKQLNTLSLLSDDSPVNGS